MSPSWPAREIPRARLRGYLGALGALAACTALSFANVAAFCIALPVAILAITVRFGVGPAVFTAAAGVMVFDFVFVPPAFAFSLPELKDGLTLAVILGLAVVEMALAEQLRRQARLARRQAEVEQLRNALLSTLSHDLRTPLGALVGMGNALADDQLSRGERHDIARVVSSEASRLARLVNNLLELTRLESGTLVTAAEPHALDEVIGAVLVRLEAPLGGRTVTADVPESIPLVPFDPILIEQVFINLFDNVLRHTPPGTPVHVRVRDERTHVLVEVADRGAGVPPADRERVFEKAYRSPARRGDGGFGLGLTICRAILEAHDGRIVLAAREGGGAVARFMLPVQRRTSAFADEALLLAERAP